MSDFRIIGNANPIVGVTEIYSIDFSSLPNIPSFQIPSQDNLKNTFENQVKWTVHVLEHGRWRETKGNKKHGNPITYTFYQRSLTRDALRIKAEINGLSARIDIKAQNAECPRILAIDLLDSQGKKPIKQFAYGEWFIARVHGIHMDRRRIFVTLWEDDSKGPGHNKANTFIKSETGIVKEGIADIKFFLDPSNVWLANAKLAPSDQNEGENHEYYVTAEFFFNGSPHNISSNNTNVPNPDYKPASLKQTPAEQKGISQKDTRGINKAENKVFDYHETKVSVKPVIELNPVIERYNKVMTVKVNDNWWEKKEEKKGICECEAKVKAFMRMLRVGEGTEGDSGYTTAFDNNKITDLSSHPQINYGGSTAAGAYQVMRYTWWWLNGEELDEDNLKTGIYTESHDYIKKYKILDYKQESQDKVCLIIMKHKRKGLIDLIISDQIEKAIRNIASLEWASLPHIGDNSKYKYKGKPQPATPMIDCLKNYQAFLKEELSNKQTWSLHLKNGFLKEFDYHCCDDNKENISNCLCGKTHYNIANPEHWIHQEPSECWAASVKILKNYGIDGGGRTNCIIIANQKGKTLTPLDVQKGIDYIDSQLKMGNPIVVGLDDNLRETTYNVHKATDHFFVIVGSGCEDGKRFYNFFDVGSKTKEKGTDSSNKLTIKDNLLIQGKSNGGTHDYTITEIRRNN